MKSYRDDCQAELNTLAVMEEKTVPQQALQVYYEPGKPGSDRLAILNTKDKLLVLKRNGHEATVLNVAQYDNTVYHPKGGSKVIGRFRPARFIEFDNMEYDNDLRDLEAVKDIPRDTVQRLGQNIRNLSLKKRRTFIAYLKSNGKSFSGFIQKGKVTHNFFEGLQPKTDLD